MKNVSAAFWLFGIGFLVFGGNVIANAPTVTQQTAGILLVLCGIVAAGFGAVIWLLAQVVDAREEP